MFCANCGNKLIEGGRFCSACGSPMAEPASQAVAPAPKAGSHIAPPPIQAAPVAPPPVQAQVIAPPPIQPQAAVSSPATEFQPPVVSDAEHSTVSSPVQIGADDDSTFYAPGGPAAQQMTPDGRPEELLLAITGGWEWMENDVTESEPGYWLVTNKRIGFIDYSPEEEEYVYVDEDGNEYTEEEMEEYGYDYEDETEPFTPELWMLDDEEWCSFVFPLNHIHSIRVEKIVGDRTNHFYLYHNEIRSAKLTGKNHKQFMPVIRSLIPELLVLEISFAEHYEPSISVLDPRNPLGTRYNANHPRGYAAAYSKTLRKNPHGMDHAIDAAIQAGMLPADFDLAAHGLGKGKTPPGVPCVLGVLYS